MSIFDGYKREERTRLEPGDHRVEIVAVEETVSKGGNPMLVITLRPAGSDIKIKHYIVKNEWFNRNITDLCDSFSIAEGDWNILGWVGTIGAAHLVEDDNGYLKVKYLLRQDRQDKLPPWPGELPQRQKVDSSFTAMDEDESDLPF